MDIRDQIRAQWAAIVDSPAPGWAQDLASGRATAPSSETPAARTSATSVGDGRTQLTWREVAGRIRGDSDHWLLGIVVAIQAGDTNAGLLLVRAMLPRLQRDARRDPQADLGDYVTHLWLTAAAYPVARRPRSVAANLALDARKAVFRERPRVTWQAPPDDLRAAQVIDAARTHDLITDDTAEVLALVYADSIAPVDASARAGISHPALRQRCSRAVRQMRAHRELLAA